MADILQLELLAGGAVAAGANVLFDTIVLIDGNIAYDTATGVITINEAGQILINWWVATQTSVSTTGAVFAIRTSLDGDHTGNSPLKTGEVVGASIIDVETAPVTIALVNASSADFFYSAVVPVKAALVMTRADGGATGATGPAGPTGDTGPTGATGPAGGAAGFIIPFTTGYVNGNPSSNASEYHSISSIWDLVNAGREYHKQPPDQEYLQ